MAHDVFEFVNRNGEKVFGDKWLVENKASKASIVLVHGMAEYAFRYDEFARFLNDNNYDVYALDHIGHGRNCPNPKTLGIWPLDGFDRCVDNFTDVVDSLQKDGKEVYVFAHSMGSFMGQSFMERYPGKVKKIVLCGSSGPQFLHKMGKIVISLHVLGKKKTKPSKFLNGVAYGSYLSKTEEKTKNAWISRNKENVDKYNKDSYCGFIPSLAFFKSFMADGISKTHKKKNIKKIDKNQKVLLIVGQDDPVGNYSKSLFKLNDIYKGLGIESNLIVYPKMRHELLNEDNKEDVMNDVLKFLEK